MKKTTNEETRQRRKWWRRAGLAAAVLLILVMAAPFLAPGPLVRFALRRFAAGRWRDVQFRSASLRPWGVLRLVDVSLPDDGANAGKRLLAAGSVELTFGWSDLRAARFKTIAIENLDATARPSSDASLTLIRLFTGNATVPAATAPAATAPAAAVAAPAVESAPLWFDSLRASGTLHTESLDVFTSALNLPANASLPVRLLITMKGDRRAPVRDVSASLGDAEVQPSAPMLVTRFHVQPAGAANQITLDSFIVSNVSAMVPADLAKSLRPGSAKMDRLELTGAVTVGAGGGATHPADLLISVSAKLRDGSARAAGDGPAFSLDHLNAVSHIEGRLAFSDTWWKELTLTNTQASWDALQFADYTMTHAIAEFAKDGGAIELTALEAMLGTADLRASATFDPAARRFTRGFIRLNNVDAVSVLARFPGALRRAVPGELDGLLGARLFLMDSDESRYAITLEVDAPGDLGLRAFAPATRRGAATGPAPRTPQYAVLSHLAMRANLSWNGHFDALPEVSNGRMRADELNLFPPGNEAPTSVSRIASDFSLSRGQARLEDLYANLPDGGRLKAEATYTVKSLTLENARFTLDDIDASLINKWMPAGLSTAGNFDFDAQASGTPAALALGVTLSASPESGFKIGDGAVTITGAPTLNVRSHVDTGSREWTLDAFDLKGVTAHVDAPLVRTIRDALHREPGDALDTVLARMKTGATVSWGTLAATGRVAGNGPFDAAMTLDDFHFALPREAENPLALAGVSIHLNSGGVLRPEQFLNALQLHGTLAAKNITVGANPIDALAASLDFGQRRALVSNLAFQFAQARFTGDADFSLAPAPTDKLDLRFSALDQKDLTDHLAPERFRAEGLAHGTLLIHRLGTGPLAGEVHVDTDGPGRLIMPRETTQAFAPAAQAAAAVEGSFLPANFDEIVMQQLTNYAYVTGQVVMRDSDKGLQIQMNYTRSPLTEGEPGYAVPINIAGQSVLANLEFHLKGSVTVRTSIVATLRELVGGGGVPRAGP